MKKIIMLLVLLAAFGLGFLICLYRAETTDRPVTTNLPSAPAITAGSAVLMDNKTGEMLFVKNEGTKAYPASTTKIMTALVALELCAAYDIDLQTKVTVPAEAVATEGSSIYLKTGEMRTIEQLLYGLMLQSGNDAATTLAICLGGNEEHFVQLMNEKAQSLHCSGTNFVNPSGLFAEQHFTTAEELARIARKAMENDTFRQIVSAKSWGSFQNKNKTLFQYHGGNGIKIGYTEKSGRTLVASAARGGEELICVVLDDSNWFADAYALLDYGFHLKGVTEDV